MSDHPGADRTAPQMTENDNERDHTHRRPTVLIADDHSAMREALARLVRTECDVVGMVADGDVLVTEARRLRPDVVISDLFMPTLDGFAAGRQIKRELPATRLIYVTGHSDSAFVAEALQIGAFALVAKISAGRELLQVLRQAMSVEPVASSQVDAAGPDTIARARLPPTADPYQAFDSRVRVPATGWQRLGVCQSARIANAPQSLAVSGDGPRR